MKESVELFKVVDLKINIYVHFSSRYLNHSLDSISMISLLSLWIVVSSLCVDFLLHEVEEQSLFFRLAVAMLLLKYLPAFEHTLLYLFAEISILD